MRTGCVIVCALTMVTASAAFAKRPMRVETRSAVEVLGITNAPPVDTGLVFIGGKYIPPPYVVGRVGNELRINGVYAENLLKWPPPPQPVFGVVTNLPPVLKTFKKTDRYFGGKHIFQIISQIVLITSSIKDVQTELKRSLMRWNVCHVSRRLIPIRTTLAFKSNG